MTPEEAELEYQKIGLQSGKTVDAVKKTIKDENSEQSLQSELLHNKVMDFLFQENKKSKKGLSVTFTEVIEKNKNQENNE